MVTVKAIIPEGSWTHRGSVDRLKGVLEPLAVLYKYLCVVHFFGGRTSTGVSKQFHDPSQEGLWGNSLEVQ